MTISLTRATSLKGRVLSPSGAPVAGARVTVAAQADKDGGFFPPELLGMFGGPKITTTLSLYQFIGYNLLIVAAILALRVLFTILRSR